MGEDYDEQARIQRSGDTPVRPPNGRTAETSPKRRFCCHQSNAACLMPLAHCQPSRAAGYSYRHGHRSLLQGGFPLVRHFNWAHHRLAHGANIHLPREEKMELEQGKHPPEGTIALAQVGAARNNEKEPFKGARKYPPPGGTASTPES